MKSIRIISLLARIGLLSGLYCGAQQAPVAVTVHVTTPKKVALRNASIGISTGPGQPFAFLRSNARGNLTISLSSGEHDLRIEVHGYPMTYERVEVSAPATIDIVLGHGTAAKPAHAVAGAPAAAPAKASTKAAAKSPSNLASALPAPTAITSSSGIDPLQAYTSCFFPDGLQVLSVQPLSATVTSRTVDTANGSQKIDLVAGRQVLVAYPFTDFFANVRAEELPGDRYAAQKAALIANLAYQEAQPGGPQQAQSLPRNLHGFDAYGNNRTKLEGSVLGMYVLFDDVQHVATTISFLNQESWRRKFQTMEDYTQLRDRFLATYTGCVRQNQAIGK